jgi:hypothetical protein
MAVIRRVNQGTYITQETKAALEREAKRRGVFTTTLASNILEQAAKRIVRGEKK